MQRQSNKHEGMDAEKLKSLSCVEPHFGLSCWQVNNSSSNNFLEAAEAIVKDWSYVVWYGSWRYEIKAIMEGQVLYMNSQKLHLHSSMLDPPTESATTLPQCALGRVLCPRIMQNCGPHSGFDHIHCVRR